MYRHTVLQKRLDHLNGKKSEDGTVATDLTSVLSVYSKFRCDLITACGSDKDRIEAISQCIAFLENIARLINCKRVSYGVLASVHIFQHTIGRVLREDEEKAARILFAPDASPAFIVKSLQIVSKVVNQIRNTCGFKEVQDAINLAWSQVDNKSKLPQDNLAVGLKTYPNKLPHLDASIINVFDEIEQWVGTSKSSFLEAHSDMNNLSSFTPNIIEWNQVNSEIGKTSNAVVLLEMEQSPADVPCSSTSLDDNKLRYSNLVTFVETAFPDSYSTMLNHLMGLLNSEKSSDELGGELLDLFGFDHFDMIGQVLEQRYSICEDYKNGQKLLTRKTKLDSLNQQGGPIYCQQVVVNTKNSKSTLKETRKEQKKIQKELSRIQKACTEDEKIELQLAHIEAQRQRDLEREQRHYQPTLISKAVKCDYPYVFDAKFSTGTSLVTDESNEDIRTSYHTHEEVVVPAVSRDSIGKIDHVYIKDMDELGQIGFKGFEKLNVIQSLVFEQAYKTNENLLICAPTGAGKTNIAMLTILNILHQYVKSDGSIAKDDFKIIYIAPMKALATEMTDSFSKRLAPFGLKVRELTGDTQLSQKEIAETQMLVLTPEKWDVVTRKASSDNSLSGLVRLLIIDEVHLLHDDRGAVIETIVARTLRQVEMAQRSIRIVGLSATLPNYIDAAEFLRVNPQKGMFFFDGRFRPVPLTQKFIGIKKIGAQRDLMTTMDEVCYDEVMRFVKHKHQVLVFVHSRNSTSKLAQIFRNMASCRDGHLEAFLPDAAYRKDRNYIAALRAVQSHRFGNMSELFAAGFGVHHAGLTRPQRLLMEKAFREGHINVMFCTSTLAWGVNLPAHAVVIRGTDVFDAEVGGFKDLGVLDVQQIFGRAGRPQFENEGHGTIITMRDKLDHYLRMLVRQTPIESKFPKRLKDHLNAEIALGTVSSVEEAVEWLTYTYYYTRASRNPLAYGLSHTVLAKDPGLRNHLASLVTATATKLDQLEMTNFDEVSGYLSATDLGRIASDFYICCDTIETLMFDKSGDQSLTLSPVMTDDIILSLISMCAEFSQLRVRDEDVQDLSELVSFYCMLPIRGFTIVTPQGKVNALLQCNISQAYISNTSLSSEAYYVQQNAGRLCRAMFEIVLRKGWAQATQQFLKMAKLIEQRIWPNQSSLRQLSDFIPTHILEKVERRKDSEEKLLSLESTDLGYMFSYDGQKMYDCLRMLPRLSVEAKLKPITYSIVQVDAVITPVFYWNDKLLGKGGSQAFWLILENANENIIVHQERITFNKRKVVLKEAQHIIFTIPVKDKQLGHIFKLRLASDYYVTQDTVELLSMHNCILPKSFRGHTELLPLNPLPISTLRNPKFESIFSFSFFNPIQTQIFHTLYKTDENSLVGAPTGSGKTLCAELAMFRLLQDHPGKKIVYIAPMKALVRERVEDWKVKFGQHMCYSVVEISGDVTPDAAVLNDATILITTPEKWDGITRSWATRDYVQKVGLIIIDEIHLLGVDRGAVLEAIVTRLKLLTRKSCIRQEPARLLGLSTALANAGDVAEWLGIRDNGLFNFKPAVRPVPINVHIQGFPGPHYCPRMALMNKPAFKAIMSHSPTKPVLVFVASRRQTRLTAMAFISHLVQSFDPRQWQHMEAQELEMLLQSVNDENLKLTLPFGIGMHHAGLSQHERSLVEQLYIDKKIQVLIATATLAWGINMPAHLVIIKGTEYFDGKTCKYVDFPVTDVLQMMGRAGRPQYDTSAVAVIFVQDMKKNFYKKFLYEPFPVESSLLPVLPNHLNAEINSGMIKDRQGIMEYIAGTYLYRRLFANPMYYGLEDGTEECMIKFLIGIVDDSLEKLQHSGCVTIDQDDGSLKSTPYGRLAAIYYLQHETIRFLLDNLGENNTIEDVLKVLSHVPEYAEIPLRHNEDNVNMQLQKQLRIRFPTNLLDSSNTKAHLLFQAQFTRLEIPTDYRTDQKSVLDQCVRILQAMRDICVLKGWFSTCLLVTALQQMCHSSRWHDDHPLLPLPHIKEHELGMIGSTTTIPELQDKLGVERAKDFKDVIIRSKSFFHEKSTLNDAEITELTRHLVAWPILTVTKLVVSDGKNDMLVRFNQNKVEGLNLKSNITYRLKIFMQTSGLNKFNTKATLLRWTKEKSAGWIAALGVKNADSLLSLAHLPAVQGERVSKLEFTTPRKAGKAIITLILSSDCYLGIDQEFAIHVNVI